MGLRCSVCKHPEVAKINLEMQEGVGNMALAKHYGLTVSALDHHRVSGHAARALTAAVLGVANGPMAELVKIEVANKVWRVSKLQSHLDRLEAIMDARAEAFKHLPGGRTGLIMGRTKAVRMIASEDGAPSQQPIEESFFDRDLADEFRATLEQAAKECGEWRPNGEKTEDRGETAGITVQQIVAGGSQGAIVLERQLRDTGQPWQTRQYDAIPQNTNNSNLMSGLEARLAEVPADLLVEATHDSIQSRESDSTVSRVGGVEVLSQAAQDDDKAG